MSKKFAFLYAILIVLVFFIGCGDSALVDNNTEIPERSWTYRNHLVVPFEIKDAQKPYNILFKLRHTADYRYSNLFVLVNFKQVGAKSKTLRYQFKLAKPDGEWLGSGSGNIFSYAFPLFTNYRFPKTGKYVIEIEQNMRNNPLHEISDVGLIIK